MNEPSEQREIDAEYERWLTCYACRRPVDDERDVEIIHPVPTAADPYPPFFAPCCPACKERGAA